jgi:hypothetical protein
MAFFPAAEPDLDEAQVRELLAQAIKRSRLTREVIAERMGTTKAVLDAFTADSKASYRFPVSYLVRFCRATGDLTIVHRLLGTLGVPFHRDAAEAMFAELGRLQVEREQSEAREQEIKRQLHKVTK